MGVVNSKIAFFDFLYYECDAAEEYLESMAKKGWLLQSIHGAFLKFKRIEPARIRYSVDVLHKISELDPRDSILALERRRIFKDTGWNYVCEKGKMQIFYCTDYDNAPVIISDANEKFKSVFKASIYKILGQFIITLLFVLNLYMQLGLSSLDFTLATNIGVLSAASMLTLVVINLILIVSFFIWAIKTKRNLRKNKFLPYNSSSQVRRKYIFFCLFGIFLILALLQSVVMDKYNNKTLAIYIFLIMLVPVVITILARWLVSRKRYSRNTNMAILRYTPVKIINPFY